jgi:hypothetical protein
VVAGIWLAFIFRLAAARVGPVQINASEPLELEGFKIPELMLFLSKLAGNEREKCQ